MKVGGRSRRARGVLSFEDLYSVTIPRQSGGGRGGAAEVKEKVWRRDIDLIDPSCRRGEFDYTSDEFGISLCSRLL